RDVTVAQTHPLDFVRHGRFRGDSQIVAGLGDRRRNQRNHWRIHNRFGGSELAQRLGLDLRPLGLERGEILFDQLQFIAPGLPEATRGGAHTQAAPVTHPPPRPLPRASPQPPVCRPQSRSRMTMYPPIPCRRYKRRPPTIARRSPLPPPPGSSGPP